MKKLISSLLTLASAVASAQVSDESIKQALDISAQTNRPVLVTQGQSAAIADASGKNSNSFVNRLGLEFATGFTGQREDDPDYGGAMFQPRFHVRLFEDQMVLYTGFGFGAAEADEQRYGARFVLSKGHVGTTSESDFWLGVEVGPGTPVELTRKNFQSAYLVGTHMGKVSGSGLKARGILEAGLERYERTSIYPRRWGGRVMGGLVLQINR